MASFAVFYGTSEGQTEKIATRIRDLLIDRGHDATAINTEGDRSEYAIGHFDAVLVGASIHVGKHQSSIRKFVTANRDTLSTKPTAFFQVSMSSADPKEDTKAASYVEEFITDTGWHPDRIALFGGALRYTQYGFLKRLMMKQIVKRTISEIPDPDPHGDVEFTDWTEVEAFAADIAAFVEGRLGITPPSTDSQDTI